MKVNTCCDCVALILVHVRKLDLQTCVHLLHDRLAFHELACLTMAAQHLVR